MDQTNNAPLPVSKVNFTFLSVLKESFNFFKINFKQVFYYFFVFLIISSTLGTLFKFVSALKIYLSGPEKTTPTFFIVFMIITGIISAVIGFVATILQAGSVLILKDIDDKQEEGVFVKYKKVLSFTLPIFVVSIVSTFFVASGLFLFVVPGIIFGLAAYFATTVVLLENKKSLDAITQSFWYTRGKRFKLFLFSLLLGLIILLSLVVIGAIVFAVGYGIVQSNFDGNFSEAFVAFSTYVKEFSSFKNPFSSGSIIFSVLSILIPSFFSAILYGFTFIFSYHLYKVCKEDAGPIDENYRIKTRKIVKGFTIGGFVVVPLLVITILSSIVLVSLNSAREKALGASGKVGVEENYSSWKSFEDKETKVSFEHPLGTDVVTTKNQPGFIAYNVDYEGQAFSILFYDLKVLSPENYSSFTSEDLLNSYLQEFKEGSESRGVIFAAEAVEEIDYLDTKALRIKYTLEDKVEKYLSNFYSIAVKKGDSIYLISYVCGDGFCSKETENNFFEKIKTI